MNIDVYRDTDGSVYLVFDGGDSGIVKHDSDGYHFSEWDKVPTSAVLLVPETP